MICVNTRLVQNIILIILGICCSEKLNLFHIIHQAECLNWERRVSKNISMKNALQWICVGNEKVTLCLFFSFLSGSDGKRTENGNGSHSWRGKEKSCCIPEILCPHKSCNRANYFKSYYVIVMRMDSCCDIFCSEYFLYANKIKHPPSAKQMCLGMWVKRCS